jgi:hypothetical protein
MRFITFFIIIFNGYIIFTQEQFQPILSKEILENIKNSNEEQLSIDIEKYILLDLFVEDKVIFYDKVFYFIAFGSDENKEEIKNIIYNYIFGDHAYKKDMDHIFKNYDIDNAFEVCTLIVFFSFLYKRNNAYNELLNSIRNIDEYYDDYLLEKIKVEYLIGLINSNDVILLLDYFK